MSNPDKHKPLSAEELFKLLDINYKNTSDSLSCIYKDCQGILHKNGLSVLDINNMIIDINHRSTIIYSNAMPL